MTDKLVHVLKGHEVTTYPIEEAPFCSFPSLGKARRPFVSTIQEFCESVQKTVQSCIERDKYATSGYIGYFAEAPYNSPLMNTMKAQLFDEIIAECTAKHALTIRKIEDVKFFKTETIEMDCRCGSNKHVKDLPVTDLNTIAESGDYRFSCTIHYTKM